MEASIDMLLQIIGEEHVKVRLLEEQISKLQETVAQLAEKAKEPNNGN